jgi:hypothetical protein
MATVIIVDEVLQNLGLWSVLKAFQQERIFIVPHMLWHRTSVFLSHPKDRPIQSLLTTHNGCGGPILTRILTGLVKIKADMKTCKLKLWLCPFKKYIKDIHLLYTSNITYTFYDNYTGTVSDISQRRNV